MRIHGPILLAAAAVVVLYLAANDADWLTSVALYANALLWKAGPI
jgi:hypothetical protein